MAPFFGWSYYSLEGALTSCSVEWSVRSFNVISYNMFIFIVTFLIPVLVIVISNVGVLIIVRLKSYISIVCKSNFNLIFLFFFSKKKKRRTTRVQGDFKVQSQVERERRLAIIMLGYIGRII